MKQTLELKVNRQVYEVSVEPWRSLAEVLREELGLTGVKVACNTGNCGSCTVLIDGKAVKSCLMLAPQAKGKEILTIEGLASEEEMHPLQKAFIEHFAVQCGYCTPGMILKAKALLDENPDATEDEIRSGLSGDPCRCTGYKKIVEAIIAAKEEIKGAKAGKKACLGEYKGKEIAAYSTVGKSVARLDAPEKVTGRAKYCTDLKLTGMLHSKILRSPYAQAKIISIDTSKAEKLSGVRGVVTGKDAPEKRCGGLRYALDQHLLARNVVRFVGEAVAAVAADTIEIAEEALALIDVKYEEMPAIFNVEEAWRTAPPVIVHPDLPKYEQPLPSVRLDPDRPNVCNHYRIRRGNVERGFQEADLIIKNGFTTARIQHCAPEPPICIAQIEPDGTLTVWSTRQGLYGTKRFLCAAFDLPPSKVRVISSHYIGGAFGSKFMFAVEPIAVMLAMKTGRPVKVALTMEEVFTCGGNRIPAVIYIKDGVKEDGTLVAREIKMLINVGAYASTGGALLTRNVNFGAVGTYRTPNLKLDSYGVYTNEPPVCAFRGFGSEQAVWAIESQVNMIAEKLGLDPVEIRLKNLLKEGDVNANGQIVHSTGARQCLEKVAEFIEWGKKAREEEGPWKRGKGLALGNKFSMAPAVSIAIVKLQEDGTVEVRYSADELGQGASTVMANIVAEEFGVPVDMVRVVWGDTAITPYSTESLSQGTTFNTGNSVRLACQDAKRQLFEIAAEKLGALPEDLDAKEGRVYVKSAPSRSIKISNLFTAGAYVEKGGEILGKDIWIQPHAPEDPETGQIIPELAQKGLGPSAFYSHAAQAVEVAVNVETGEVKIVKVGAACDVGFPINPKMCEQQMEGGVGMGIGSALWEEMIMDKGKVLNPNWRDYGIPSALNMPKLDEFKTFIVLAPHKDGPYGAKGMGEVVLTPTAPAIANAIYNAIGVRIKDLPMTRERIFKALKNKR